MTLRRNLDNASAALTPEIEKFMRNVGEHSPFLDEDRPLEAELRALTKLIRSGHWVLYSNV